MTVPGGTVLRRATVTNSIANQSLSPGRVRPRGGGVARSKYTPVEPTAAGVQETPRAADKIFSERGPSHPQGVHSAEEIIPSGLDEQALDGFGFGRVARGVDLLDVAGGRDGGGRGVADGVGDLPHVLAADIARHVQAWNDGLHLLIGEDKTLIVLRKLGSEDLTVGHEADVDEDATDVQAALLARIRVAQTQPLDLVGSADLLDHGIPDGHNLRVRPRPLLQELLGAPLLATVNDVDLLAVARQEGRLLDRAVAAADHCQDLPLEEGAVTDRAVADAATGKLGLTRHAQSAG